MSRDQSEMEPTWNARMVQPVVLLYVSAVFAGFMALAGFVFHSREAVQALAMAAITGIGSLTPSVLSKTEYRFTGAGLEKRPLRPRKPKEFKEVFTWERLNHLVPTSSGFKYYSHLQEQNPVRRFWKMHIASGYSGELHVEEGDRKRVLAVFTERGVPISKGPPRVPPPRQE